MDKKIVESRKNIDIGQKKQMKIAKKIVLIIVVILLYYTVVILNARAKTPALVQAALNSEGMKLELNDLTNDQLQALLKIQDQIFTIIRVLTSQLQAQELQRLVRD